ncbi:MAG: sulfotransferase family protein [Schleiferiaceae bacterium]
MVCIFAMNAIQCPKEFEGDLGVMPFMSTKYIGCAGLVVLILFFIRENQKVSPTTKDLRSDISKPLPFLVKAIDDILDSLPVVLWDVNDPEKLLKAGARNAGLPESGYSPDVVKAIRALCRSLEQDNVKLHWVGRKNFHTMIVTGLSGYLQIQEAHRSNPELSMQALNDPIIVVGLPRSGTTHLHRLLALAPDSLSIPLYEHNSPVPPKRGIDMRRWILEARFFVWKPLANRFGMDSVHLIRPNLPDECTFSLRLSGCSHLFWWMTPVYSYLEWLTSPDATMEESYKTYRRVLQLIQARDPSKRIILKCPTHILALDTLSKVIPEARIVLTHRDPTKLVASEASLIARLHTVSAKHPIDSDRSVKANAIKSIHYSQKLVEFASRCPKHKVYNVAYNKLVNDPVALVEDIYKFCGIDMTPAFEELLSEHLSQNKQHSHGKHNYPLKIPGLTEMEIDEGLKDYRDFFAEYIG